MSNSDTEIETYLTYEDAFSEVQKGTPALPLSYLDDERSIDNLIHELGEIRQGGFALCFLILHVRKSKWTC